MDKNETYIQIIKDELVPALGCTEPIALAYAGAIVKETLKQMPTSIVIEVSGNIIKNVKSVIVPNTDGKKGIEAAVLAGVVAGDASLELQVIANISDIQRKALKEALESIDVVVKPLHSKHVLDIKVHGFVDGQKAMVQIVDRHQNVVLVSHNDKEVYKKDIVAEAKSEEIDKSALSVEGIYKFCKEEDISEIIPVLKRQIECNSAIANEGLENSYGANIGSVLLNGFGDDIITRAKAYAAAGSDARMSGCQLPVIINSGSGNQGMTVSLPVIEYAKYLKVSNDKLYRGLALANLIAIHQKTGIGRLSAYCGAVSAGVGAGCGIAFLHDEGLDCMNHTIVNAVMIVSGMICDGAKPSCAAKIASAVDAGILGYLMYKQGQEFKDGDGLVGCCVEGTIKNIGRLSSKGMKETDKEIIAMMTNNE